MATHVIRVNDLYYLYATTHTRGYDVYTSPDLVNWTNRGLAFDDSRRGVWAPDVFHHRRGDGKFYLYYTDSAAGQRPGGPKKQIGVAVADSPLGPFVDHAVLVTNAIDAHVFQDDDGMYFTTRTGKGFKSRQRMTIAAPRSEPKFFFTRPIPGKASGRVTGVLDARIRVYYLMYSDRRGFTALRNRLCHASTAGAPASCGQPHCGGRQRVRSGTSLRSRRSRRPVVDGVSPESERGHQLGTFPRD